MNEWKNELCETIVAMEINGGQLQISPEGVRTPPDPDPDSEKREPSELAKPHRLPTARLACPPEYNLNDCDLKRKYLAWNKS